MSEVTAADLGHSPPPRSGLKQQGVAQVDVLDSRATYDIARPAICFFMRTLPASVAL